MKGNSELKKPSALYRSSGIGAKTQLNTDPGGFKCKKRMGGLTERSQGVLSTVLQAALHPQSLCIEK